MQSGILVDISGNARIADFGYLRIARNKNADNYRIGPSLWATPEIRLGDFQVTKESDIFSFGMVIIEVRGDRTVICKPTHPLHKVFTGEVPFGKNDWPTITKIRRGKRPSRPNHPDFTESLWVLTQRCWSHKPRDRPKIEEVIEVLKEL